jgi:hypothetical protein
MDFAQHGVKLEILRVDKVASHIHSDAAFKDQNQPLESSHVVSESVPALGFVENTKGGSKAQFEYPEYRPLVSDTIASKSLRVEGPSNDQIQSSEYQQVVSSNVPGESKARFNSSETSHPGISGQDAVLVGSSSVLNGIAAPAVDGSSGNQFKSPLFDNLGSSSSTWENKLPQEWIGNDVTSWLENNAISKPSVESFRGIFFYFDRKWFLIIFFYKVHSIDGQGLMEIARNGLAFVKMTLERDFKIDNVVEQAKLTRLIIQLFPNLNPHLNRAQTVESASLSQSNHPENLPYDDSSLPAYEEF